jgi:SPP1 gp7 family putative phage head morphogenesis protein
MAKDKARDYTDRKLNELEKALSREYSRAKSEIEAEWKDYMQKHGAKAEELYNALRAARHSGDSAAIKDAKEKYQAEMRRITSDNKRYKQMVQETADKLAHIDKVAYDMANNVLGDVYAVNYNSLKLPRGYSYKLVDARTVKNLALGQIDLLKDERWNKQRLNGEVLQGILRGESMDKIAERISPMVDGNRAAAIRNARTAVTSAENRGRIDGMKAVDEECGLVYEKRWIATNDSRTRESHADIDGETVPLDEPFSNGLMYPADPDGEPEEVFNCFVGKTNVAIDSDIVRSYKHEYKGELVSIKTAVGVQFTCTPNHPILTMNGWKAANLIDEFDDLVIARFGDGHIAGGNPNIDHIAPTFEAIHDTLDKTGRKRTCRLGVNFHGDIPATDVEIIRQKRLLRNGVNASRRKRRTKFAFKLSDKAYLALRPLDKRVERIMGITPCFLSGKRNPFAFVGRRVRHTDNHSFGTVAALDFVFPQYAVNNLAANGIVFSKDFDGNAISVLFDNVVSVKREFAHSFVYNLQTDNGYYFVNTIVPQNGEKNNGYFAIAHNCRCTMDRVLVGVRRADGTVREI